MLDALSPYSRDDLDMCVCTGSPWPCGGQLNPMLCPSAAAEIGREGVNWDAQIEAWQTGRQEPVSLLSQISLTPAPHSPALLPRTKPHTSRANAHTHGLWYLPHIIQLHTAFVLIIKKQPEHSVSSWLFGLITMCELNVMQYFLKVKHTNTPFKKMKKRQTEISMILSSQIQVMTLLQNLCTNL